MASGLLLLRNSLTTTSSSLPVAVLSALRAAATGAPRPLGAQAYATGLPASEAQQQHHQQLQQALAQPPLLQALAPGREQVMSPPLESSLPSQAVASAREHDTAACEAPGMMLREVAARGVVAPAMLPASCSGAAVSSRCGAPAHSACNHVPSVFMHAHTYVCARLTNPKQACGACPLSTNDCIAAPGAPS